MTQDNFDNYETLLAEAGKFHGGTCAGIKIGTRMTMCGLKRIGVMDPKGADRKNLIIFVEIDRCCTDAIMALTGCRPGKRSMKIRDYGKMAATFINLETGKAVRISMKGRKMKSDNETSDPPDFATASEEELFNITDVAVPLAPEDVPGKPVRRVLCARCGENVMDGREIESRDGALCRPCFEKETYYYHVTQTENHEKRETV